MELTNTEAVRPLAGRLLSKEEQFPSKLVKCLITLRIMQNHRYKFLELFFHNCLFTAIVPLQYLHNLTDCFTRIRLEQWECNEWSSKGVKIDMLMLLCAEHSQEEILALPSLVLAISDSYCHNKLTFSVASCSEFTSYNIMLVFWCVIFRVCSISKLSTSLVLIRFFFKLHYWKIKSCEIQHKSSKMIRKLLPNWKSEYQVRLQLVTIQ